MIGLEKSENHGARTETIVSMVSFLLSIGAVLFQIYGLAWLYLVLIFSSGIQEAQPAPVLFAEYFFIFGVIPFGIVTLVNYFISRHLPLVIRIQRFLKFSIIILVINLLILASLLPAAIPAELKILKKAREAAELKALIIENERVQDEQRAATLIEESKVKTFAIEALSYLADSNTEKFISVLSQDTLSETESSELKDVVASHWMPYFSNLGREKVAELINNNTGITLGFAGTNGNITQLEIGVSGDSQDSGLTVVHLEKEAGGYTVRMILLTSSDDSDDPAMVDRYFRNLR